MARGKHAERKRSRDARQLTHHVEQARAELAEEQTRLRAAVAEAEQVRLLEQRLAQALDERDRSVAGEVIRVEREIAAMTALLTEGGVLAERATKEWHRTTEAVAGLLGGGLEGWENFNRIAFTGGYIYDVAGDPRRLGGLGAQRVQKARGVRRQITLTDNNKPDARHLDAALRRRDYQALHNLLDIDQSTPDTMTEQDRRLLADYDRRLERLDKVGPTDVDPDTIHAWYPMLWLGSLPTPSHPIRDLLGVVHPPADHIACREMPTPVPEPTADLTATRRSLLAATDPEQLIAGWQRTLHRSAAITAVSSRVPWPWSDPPRYSRPGDAVTIKHWYTLSALGHWSRLYDTATHTRSEPDIAQDDVAPIRAELPAAAAVAVGMTAAVPFWLPPGQTAAYVDSEPLPEADRADIRLPFPQVLLVLADPLHLPPLADIDADEARDHALAQFDNAVLAQQRLPNKQMTYGQVVMNVIDTEVWDHVPDLVEAIAARGAMVEAVLLLGDSLGTPDDVFGWCLAVPASTGGLLGRWVLPARRSATAFADQITNLAAVAAWADWHGPDRELALAADLSSAKLQTVLQSSDFRHLEQRGGAGGVHVLNIKHTTGETAADGDGPARTVAPHVRRGHWRRQHHGHQRQLVKRVRIAPVLVNAGRRDMAPRVYRLPVPVAGDGERREGGDTVT